MAQAIKYKVPPAPTSTTKEDELDGFLEALHESGTLRTLTAFFGRFEGVSEVFVDQLNTPGGLNAISNVALLATALSNLDSDLLSKVVHGMDEGLEAAVKSMEDEPPTLLKLVRQLNDAETRRGLYAMLVLLQSVGRRVHESGPQE